MILTFLLSFSPLTSQNKKPKLLNIGLFSIIRLSIEKTYVLKIIFRVVVYKYCCPKLLFDPSQFLKKIAGVFDVLFRLGVIGFQGQSAIPCLNRFLDFFFDKIFHALYIMGFR